MEGYSSIQESVQDYMEAVRRLIEKDEAKEPGEAGGRFRQKAQEIKERERQTEIFLPFPYLQKRYALDETQFWLVVSGFAFEMDNGLYTAYGRKSGPALPDFQYGLHMLSAAFLVSMDMVAGLCGSEHPLWEIFRFEAGPDGYGEMRHILAQPMLLRREAVYFLYTGKLLDQSGIFRCLYPGSPVEADVYTKSSREIGRCLTAGRPWRVLLFGRKGSGKKQLLAGLCTKHNIQGLLTDAAELLSMEEREQENVLRVIRFCTAVDYSPVLIEWDGTGDIGKEAAKLRRILDRFLRDRLVFVLAEEETAWGCLMPHMDLKFGMKEYLTASEKSSILKACVPKAYRRNWQDELLARYGFLAGELTEKLWKIAARTEVEGQLPDHAGIWGKVLQEDAAAGSLGELVRSKDTLEDFAGSEENKGKLQKVIRLAAKWQKNAERLQEAGMYFPETLLLLFHGPSGTGKTMSASILSQELGLPMLKVNLSRVFDKYIGETEKHLDDIFRTAQRNNQILFFDEADALFSKRTQVEDSHDKYANISTSYLLQRIENHNGIIVLATNLIHHFDDAFLRRIRFVIKFTPLDTGARAELWTKVLRGPLPLAGDICPEKLAQAAGFSAARIKSAALIAYMLAMEEESSCLTCEHLEEAIRLEAEKDEMRVKKI